MTINDKEVRVYATLNEAYELQVTVNGLEAYKDAFLRITNNVRAYPQLLRVAQNSRDDIFVTCKPSAVKDTVDWLESFGTVKEPRKVLVASISEDDTFAQLFDDVEKFFDEYHDFQIITE